MKLFSVRDLSGRFKLPTFDILFDDEMNNCVRCSFKFYDNKTDAQSEAYRLDASLVKPTEWDRVLTKL